MKKQDDKNRPQQAKTVISKKAEGAASISGLSAESSFVPDDISETELATNQQKALTEIETSLQSHTTEQGFATAKADADKALAENKIVLNHRFVLQETLGSGGMGTVYKAQDLRKVEARDNNPYVAAKILNNDFRNHPDAFISLQREASRSHLLSHPNIVTVHDFDRDGDTIFMTMELLEGEDLEQLINRHKDKGLEKDRALKIFEGFCLALDFAHQKGIIHSDLKPGNIFVTKEEGAKVLDFGIARLGLASKNTDHFDAGRIGAITPAYASLEMIAHQEPDPRDDVYAAAVIAYELLTGTHPYGTLSAAAALAKGMHPKRIASLSNRQWKALSAGLELKRENRIASIKELMVGLTVVPKLPILSTVSTVFIGVLMLIIYNQFFESKELSQVIEETFDKANQCFLAENYQCVVESTNAILEMEPKNKEALSLKKNASIQQQINLIEQCFSVPEYSDCALKELNQLVELNPNKSLLIEVRNNIHKNETKLNIEALLSNAQTCFDRSDFSCAIEKTDELLKQSSNHQQAMDLRSKSEQLLQQEKLIKSNNDKLFKAKIIKAQECFNQGNFLCAQNESKLALEVNPGNSEASELYQNSVHSHKQKLVDLEKADKILKDGQACLKKLNFSCAIAKSESALEFVPNYKKALQLKRDATESLNQVKKKIEIE